MVKGKGSRDVNDDVKAGLKPPFDDTSKEKTATGPAEGRAFRPAVAMS